MSERIGFFTDDARAAVAVLERRVLKRRLVGRPEGLELSPAPGGPSIGQASRRVMAEWRVDLPSLWRVLIRPGSRRAGATVALLAPRGTDPAVAGAKLVAAGVVTSEMAADDEEYVCRMPVDSPAGALVAFALAALQAVAGPSPSREWMWAVRMPGLVPR